MQESTSFEVILGHLPVHIRRALGKLSHTERQSVSEIRLYSGRPVAVISPDRVMYLTAHGLSASFRNLSAIKASPEDIRGIVDSLAHFSIHSCEREFRQGFFVLRGGVRVGLSGQYSSGGVINQVTGLNFRVARNVEGCADEIYPLTEEGGVLICGGVNSGKTTLLRDLCRQVGDRRKVALIDERSEIANLYCGELSNDVGALTDVLTGCTRSEGIVAAVRTLSPDVIFCDEISTSNDSRAILESAGCGVRFCATIHAENYDGLMARPVAAELLRSGVFGNIAFLAGAHAVGKIREIRRCGNA